MMDRIKEWLLFAVIVGAGVYGTYLVLHALYMSKGSYGGY